MTAPAEYPKEHRELLYTFLERFKEHDSSYVLSTVSMIKTKFPGSAAEMLPRLRAIYREKRKAEKAQGK